MTMVDLLALVLAGVHSAMGSEQLSRFVRAVGKGIYPAVPHNLTLKKAGAGR